MLHIPWSEPTAAEDGGEDGSDEGDVLLDLGARVVSLAPRMQANMDRGSYIGEGAFPLEDQFPLADAMPTKPFPVRVKERTFIFPCPIVCRVCAFGYHGDKTFRGDTFAELVYVLPRLAVLRRTSYEYLNYGTIICSDPLLSIFMLLHLPRFRCVDLFVAPSCVCASVESHELCPPDSETNRAQKQTKIETDAETKTRHTPTLSTHNNNVNNVDE
jgi:hypothetical protein